MAQSIAIISGKGGVGKSFFSVNVAAALASEGHPTLIVDTDSGMCNADIILHKNDSFVYDLSDIAAGYCSFEDALINVWNNGAISLIAGAKNPDFLPTDSFLSKLCAVAASKFEYIILDAPAGAGIIVRNVISAADEIVIVTNPPKEAVFPAVSVSDTAWKIAPNKPSYIVLNRVNPKGIAESDVSPDEIVDLCHARLLGIVFDSPEVERCRRESKLFASCDTTAAYQLRNIAARISGKSVPLLIK